MKIEDLMLLIRAFEFDSKESRDDTLKKFKVGQIQTEISVLTEEGWANPKFLDKESANSLNGKLADFYKPGIYFICLKKPDDSVVKNITLNNLRFLTNDSHLLQRQWLINEMNNRVVGGNDFFILNQERFLEPHFLKGNGYSPEKSGKKTVEISDTVNEMANDKVRRSRGSSIIKIGKAERCIGDRIFGYQNRQALITRYVFGTGVHSQIEIHFLNAPRDTVPNLEKNLNSTFKSLYHGVKPPWEQQYPAWNLAR